MSHEWLIRFVEHRVADRRVLRLIRKWLKAGVAEDGEVTPGEVGTPQGAVISPLLANIYLHYVFDLWAEQWRQRQAHGDVIMVRYADDIVVGFEHQADAERFLAEMRERLAAFALTLHGEKTRLIRFGRFAALNRKERGEGKPETFNFLGFTHICGRSRRGGFLLRRKTRRDRMQARLLAIREGLRRRLHTTIEEQGDWLRQVMRGFPRVKPGGMLRLSRRADQLRRPGGIPGPCDPALAADAAAAQPEGSNLVGTDHRTRRSLAPQTAHRTSVAE